MKRFSALLLPVCLLALALCSCGGQSGSVPSSAAAPPPTAPGSVPVSTPASSAAPSGPAVSAAPAADLDALLARLSSAAGLEATVPMMELDLKAGGVDVESIDAFTGVQAQNYSDNGGLVLVIQAVSGAADTVVEGLHTFQAGRMDERYTEFATQVANTKEARIAQNGDAAVFVVSATGAWEDVDAALAALGFQ